MKKRITVFLLLCFFLAGLFSSSYDQAQVETLLVTTTSWDGEQIGWYPYGTPEVSVLKISVPPGVHLAVHKHPIPLVAYMLSGELSVETENGDTAVFKAGDPIVEVVETWHFGQSTGEEDAVLVAFYMGVKRLPNTIEKK